MCAVFKLTTTGVEGKAAPPKEQTAPATPGNGETGLCCLQSDIDTHFEEQTASLAAAATQSTTTFHKGDLVDVWFDAQPPDEFATGWYQGTITCVTASRCTPLHTLHITAYTAHHCTSLHTTAHHCTPLHITAHHCTPLHATHCRVGWQLQGGLHC